MPYVDKTGDPEGVWNRSDISIVLVILANISVTFLQTFEEAAGYADGMRIVEFITMAYLSVSDQFPV